MSETKKLLDQIAAQEVEEQEPDTEAGESTEQAKDGTGDKRHTQADVDRIVKERLARERAKYTPYSSFVEKQARKNGMTPDEYLQAVEDAEKLESVQDEAEAQGMDPKLYLEFKTAKDKAAQLEQEKAESEGKAKVEREQKALLDKQVTDFKEKHPTVDLIQLASNNDFLTFIDELNPKLSLAEKYDRWNRYRDGARAKADEKDQKKADRSGVNIRGGGSLESPAAALLTERQKTLAKQNGMTYEEYAGYLQHITPKQ